MNKMHDERVMAQVHKYGFEAFTILSLSLVGVIIVKSFILDLNYVKFFDLLIPLTTAGGYLVVRCIVSGVFAISSTSQGKKMFTKKVVLWNALAAVIVGVLIGVRSTFMYMDGKFSLFLFFLMLYSAVVVFLVGTVACVFVSGLSNRQASKYTED